MSNSPRKGESCFISLARPAVKAAIVTGVTILFLRRR